MTDMKVRYPQFDFCDVLPQWAPVHEWAHQVNSNGIIPSAIEPFLIKIMRRAKAQLDPVADAELIADIDIFNRQEGQHYKIHEAFNQMISDNGYPELARFDAELKAEYAEMLRTKSLTWLLGYCEGFESLAASISPIWVDGLWGDYLDGAHPQAIGLWQWHLAEEYEHRTVVHRTFHRLCEGSPEEVHNTRVEMFMFSVEHIRSRTGALRTYLIETDRVGMSDAERTESQRREEAVDAALSVQQAMVAPVLDPAYDPMNIAAPKQLHAVLAQYA